MSPRTLARAPTPTPTTSRAAASSSRPRARRDASHVARAGRRGDGADADDGPLAALKRLNPFAKKEETSTSVERAQRDARGGGGDVIPRDVREQIFGKGLMGKIVGGAANALAGQLRDQMSVAADAAARCYEDASRDVKLDRNLELALGGGRVECGPVVQQSSSSSNVNGVKTTQTFVAFQVRSSTTGRVALVRAQSNGANTTSVAQLDDGRTLEIGRASGGGDENDDPYASGGVIDVDADDVIDV